MEALRALGQQLLAIWEQLGISQRVTVVLSGLALVTALGFIVFATCLTNLRGGSSTSKYQVFLAP